MTDRYIYNSGSNTSPYDTWAKAATSITTGISGVAATDRGFVSNDHTVTAGAAITWTFPSTIGYQLLGVNTNATEPPTGLNSTPAAVEAVGAASAAFGINGFAYINAIKMQSGTNNSASCVFNVGNSTNPVGLYFDNCAFELPSANAAPVFNIGAAASGSTDDVVIDIRNSTFKFGATAQSIKLGMGDIVLRNISIDAAGSAPTTLFTGAFNAGGGSALVEASDLSGKTWTNLATLAWVAPFNLLVRNCKLPSGYAFSTGTHTGPGGLHLRVHNCDSGDTNYNYGEATNAGTIVDETTLVRSGGGAISYRMDANSNTRFPYHALTLEGAKRNTSTGSALTLTLEILHDSVTNLQDDEIWVEVQHLGVSGVPQGVIDIDDRAADVFATPADQTASSETWTTTGMSNPNKQKLACTFTPQEAGYVHFKVCLGPAAAKTVYVDMLGVSIA